MTAPTVTKTVPWRYRGSSEARTRAAEHLARTCEGMDPNWPPRWVLLGEAAMAAHMAACVAHADRADTYDIEHEAFQLLEDLWNRARAAKGAAA
jgi:hypothetical protein